MKSPMVESADDIKNKSGYTALQVLRSPAGWYIGTMYHEYGENGKLAWQEPGSRDSDYFHSKEGAEAFLKILEADEEEAPSMLREHP